MAAAGASWCSTAAEWLAPLSLFLAPAAPGVAPSYRTGAQSASLRRAQQRHGLGREPATHVLEPGAGFLHLGEMHAQDDGFVMRQDTVTAFKRSLELAQVPRP